MTGAILEAEPARRRCLAVMYHYVRECVTRPNGGIHALSPGAFREQVAELCRDFDPLDWPTFRRWQQGKYAASRDCFLLTFDDGLKDHARFVSPILEEFGVSGLFFVPGSIMRGDRLLSAHALHLLLEHASDERILSDVFCWLEADTDRKSDEWRADPVQARRMYHYEPQARACLKYLLTMVLPVDLRTRAIEAVFRRHVGNPAAWARTWYMTAEDIRDLLRKGHSIGGHGFLHEPLARLDANNLREDVNASFRSLAEYDGSEERAISFPYGSFNEQVEVACREAGFVRGFTTERAWARVGAESFGVPRVDTIHVRGFLEQERAASSREAAPCI
jgi:peptidoglycan/xylan/chitin deacetylase (PgdA/CDA1 family)